MKNLIFLCLLCVFTLVVTGVRASDTSPGLFQKFKTEKVLLHPATVVAPDFTDVQVTPVQLIADPATNVRLLKHSEAIINSVAEPLYSSIISPITKNEPNIVTNCDKLLRPGWVHNRKLKSMALHLKHRLFPYSRDRSPLSC